MRLTLGIDSSTQGVKAVAWDVDGRKVVFSASVNDGKDLPQYASPDGFLPNDDMLKHLSHYVRRGAKRLVAERGLARMSWRSRIQTGP